MFVEVFDFIVMKMDAADKEWQNLQMISNPNVV
jgi:hypothetical protein